MPMIDRIAGRLAVGTAGVAAALFLSLGSASAATLTLTAVDGNVYQHTAQNPCIISGQNCSNGGFAYTEYNNTGNIETVDTTSPEYTVSALRAIVGNSFFVGLDVNQTNANSPQSLIIFEMSVDSVLVDSYAGSLGNVPAMNNGNGYADYTISGFTSLAGFADDALVTFRARLENLNNGAERLFLISTTGPTPEINPIPLPAAGWLLLGGLGALGAAARRKRKAA